MLWDTIRHWESLTEGRSSEKKLTFTEEATCPGFQKGIRKVSLRGSPLLTSPVYCFMYRFYDCLRNRKIHMLLSWQPRNTFGLGGTPVQAPMPDEKQIPGPKPPTPGPESLSLQARSTERETNPRQGHGLYKLSRTHTCAL